jgi:hypothetical protein
MRCLPCHPACLPSCLQIRDIRLKGGDVIVSFGGAAGQELAQAISDIDELVSGAGRFGAGCLLSAYRAKHWWSLHSRSAPWLHICPPHLPYPPSSSSPARLAPGGGLPGRH